MLHYVSSVFVTMAMCPVCGVIDSPKDSFKIMLKATPLKSYFMMNVAGIARQIEVSICTTTSSMVLINNVCPECNINFNLKCNLDKLISSIHTDATSNINSVGKTTLKLNDIKSLANKLSKPHSGKQVFPELSASMMFL